MAASMNVGAVPKVSVVMSLYNSERYLRMAIDSVLTQTLSDFEFIIIDDGSKDGSAGIVRSYDDLRIRYLYQQNAGLSAALNVAIGEARSDIIARMDPDDICLPERLAVQYAYLQQHEDVVVVGTGATCIDASGESLPKIKMAAFYKTGDLPSPESPCIHPSVMFRVAGFKRADGYPEDMRFGGEDAVLFNRMLACGCVANLAEPLMLYRLHHSSMSHKSRKFNRLLRQMICQKVHGEAIPDQQFQQLAKMYKHAGSGYYGYQLYVGKLFLVSGKMDRKARGYFLKALHVNPLSVHAWACLASTYMPSGWRISMRSVLLKLKHVHL